jgi:hypothetical protein
MSATLRAAASLARTFADVFGVYAAWVVVLMQAFQSLVANRPDHSAT